jgi:hypothetical protein
MATSPVSRPINSVRIGRQKMNDDRREPFRDLASYLESSRTDEAAAYAARGRVHKQLSDEALTAEWTRYFEAFAADPSNPHDRNMARSLQMEMLLRGQSPPILEVRESAERLIRSSKELLSGLEGEELARFNDDMGRELKADRAKRNLKKS